MIVNLVENCLLIVSKLEPGILSNRDLLLNKMCLSPENHTYSVLFSISLTPCMFLYHIRIDIVYKQQQNQPACSIDNIILCSTFEHIKAMLNAKACAFRQIGMKIRMVENVKMLTTAFATRKLEWESHHVFVYQRVRVYFCGFALAFGQRLFERVCAGIIKKWQICVKTIQLHIHA